MVMVAVVAAMMMMMAGLGVMLERVQWIEGLAVIICAMKQMIATVMLPVMLPAMGCAALAQLGAMPSAVLVVAMVFLGMDEAVDSVGIRDFDDPFERIHFFAWSGKNYSHSFPSLPFIHVPRKVMAIRKTATQTQSHESPSLT